MMMSPSSVGVQTRPSTFLQLRLNHLVTFSASVKRSGVFETAIGAIDRIRMINPRCIQSDEQVRFLRVFEQALRPGSYAPAP